MVSSINRRTPTCTTTGGARVPERADWEAFLRHDVAEIDDSLPDEEVVRLTKEGAAALDQLLIDRADATARKDDARLQALNLYYLQAKNVYDSLWNLANGNAKYTNPGKHWVASP